MKRSVAVTHPGDMGQTVW